MSPADAVGYRHFHEELETLKHRLLDMSQAAEALIESAVEGLLNRDQDLAEQVIQRDTVVDSLEVEIEGRAIALLDRKSVV